MDQDLFEKGLAQRKATLGAEYVEKNLAAADDFTRPFQEAMTAWCWGFGWGDDVIDAKTRSMMNLAMIGGARQDDRVGNPLPRRCHQWRLQGGDPRHHPCDRHLLRRTAGPRVLPRCQEGVGGNRNRVNCFCKCAGLRFINDAIWQRLPTTKSLTPSLDNINDNRLVSP